jgi:hypothetical protein
MIDSTLEDIVSNRLINNIKLTKDAGLELAKDVCL